MFGWLVSFFRGVGSIDALAARVRDAVVKLANDVLSVFKGWVVSAAHAVSGVLYFTHWVIQLAASVFDFAGWLVTVALPRMLAKAWRDATTWAGQRLSALHDTVVRWIAELRAALRQEIGAITGFAHWWVDWLRTQVGSLWNRFLAVEKRAVALLTDPRALADWIAGAIIGAVSRWLYNNAETVARMVFARSTGLLLRLADRAERIIVDLFL